MSTHVWDRLSAYIDRELAQTERAAVEVHLRECADCARAVEELRAVDALARGHDVEAPAGYFEGLPGRLRTRLSPRARVRVAPWAVALAAGLAVAVVAPLVLREQPLPPPLARQAYAPAPAPTPAAGAPAARAPLAAAPPAATLLASPDPADAPRDLKKESGRVAGERPAPPVAPAAPAPAEGVAAGVEGATLGDERYAPARPDEARNRDFAVPPAVSEDNLRVEGLGRRGVDARTPAPAAGAAAPESEAEVDEEAALVSDNSGPERDAAARPQAAAARAKAAPPSRPADPRFEALAGRAARSAAEARALRDAWRAYVRENPEGPRADEARVAALEAGAAAWRLGGRPEDRAQVERDGREYLRRPEAADKERVRALLAGLP